MANQLVMCAPRSSQATTSLATTWNEAQTARFLAMQVGWLADLASTKLGHMVLYGDAEQWMCPPIYRRVAGAANGVAVHGEARHAGDPYGEGCKAGHQRACRGGW